MASSQDDGVRGLRGGGGRDLGAADGGGESALALELVLYYVVTLCSLLYMGFTTFYHFDCAMYRSKILCTFSASAPLQRNV
jgi:hypothetical protein